MAVKAVFVPKAAQETLVRREKRRGRLAYKLLLLFLVVSLGPLVFTGYHLIHVTQRSLKEESIRILESQAKGFAETCFNYVGQFKSILVSASQAEEFASLQNPARQQMYLNRLMQLHPAFLDLSVIDASGRERLRLGRFLNETPQMRDFSSQLVFLKPMKEQVEYVGSLERFLGQYPTITVSVPITDPSSRKVSGVLMAKLGLNGLTHMLHQQFPDQEDGQGPQGAVVAGSDPVGFLIAHSNQKIVFRPDASLPKPILEIILTQTKSEGGGEMPELPGGERLLGAFSSVKDLNWVVYVQQPLETAYKTANQMENQIFQMLLYVGIATTLLGFLVSSLITRPIQVLKQAALKLAQGDFENVPEVSSDDEIGDLAQSFKTMSLSLKDKTDELIRAKDELEKLNRTLENRVEARTRELKATQDELIKKEKLAAIGQMASVVGHEIRNPLAVINNSIYYVKSKLSANGAEIDAKIAKHISIIESEIQQANGIISEILTFARQRELKPEMKSLNLFIEDLLSTYPVPGSIQVLKDLCPEDPMVMIDPEEMKQAVRNLIGNAIEAMTGGGVLKVSTQVVSPQDWVRLDISDTGPGIPRDVRERIFAPFFTTKARGTGLGLAVVRKVVDHHKGKVEIVSEQGEANHGTTFQLYLPQASRLSPTSGLRSGN